MCSIWSVLQLTMTWPIRSILFGLKVLQIVLSPWIPGKLHVLHFPSSAIFLFYLCVCMYTCVCVSMCVSVGVVLCRNNMILQFLLFSQQSDFTTFHCNIYHVLFLIYSNKLCLDLHMHLKLYIKNRVTLLIFYLVF